MVRMVEAMHQVAGSDLQEIDQEEDMETQEENNTPGIDSAEKPSEEEGKPDDDAMEQDTNEEDDGSRSEATFRFTVQNFSKIKDNSSRLSEPHYVRNLPWKIMIMQRQENVYNRSGTPKTVGFFLQCNAESENYNWSCQAIADLRLINHIEGKQAFARRIQHCFYMKENDWGFSNFVSWADVLDPEKGYIKNDGVTFEVHVNAEAPHGVSWDSKKHTGYVGLKNQGATCYMNSLLQTLFFTNRLRKAVYQLPTDSDDSSKSVALALQRVFYDLQSSDKPVGTKKLTKSFGWETLDSFMQHDVQEFLRVLLDNLENKMKGTSVEGTIPQLFEGQMISFINCKHIEMKSTRKEAFYDIQLNVKGKKNVYESFQDYITVETLDGDNKYDAGEHGLQEAEKGVKFSKFPPVLHLHLMRFQYDPNTDSNIKINDRYEFPESLCLDDYKDPKSMTKDESSTYTLHAVLVHSGDNHGGHYVVFINPRGDGKWCKFDDDVVSRCTKTEAIDHNFGGSDDDMNLMAKQSSNAYMLVYMQTACLPKLLEDVTEDDVPFELSDRLREEKRLEAIRRHERSEAHLFMNVQVVTEDCFNGHQGNDLFDLEKVKYTTFKVRKQASVTDMLTIVAENMNYPLEHIRPWPFTLSRHRTYRPSALVGDEELQKSVIDITEGTNIWTIFLEVAQPDGDAEGLPYFNKEDDLLMFFKLYDPKRKKLHYCGHSFISMKSKVEELVPILNERAGFSEDTRLLLFEEVKPNTLERITNLDSLIDKSIFDLVDGIIIVFQKDDMDDMTSDLPTAKDYFKDLYFRVEVTFCDKSLPCDGGFSMELSQRMTYDQMARAVGQRLSIDPSLLQFFKAHVYRDGPGNAIKCQFDGTLKDMLMNTKSRTARKLYYQQLSMPIHELENKKQIKVIWLNSKTKEEKELVLYPNKTGTVADLLEEARQHITGTLQEHVNGKLRCLEITGNKISMVLRDDYLIDNFQGFGSQMQRVHRVEEVPQEHMNLSDDEMLIPVAHYQKHIYQSFGVPFLIKIKHGEPFHLVKDRLQKTLEVSDKEWEKYKFFKVCQQTDAQMLFDEFLMNIQEFQKGSSATTPWLGLEHVNKTPKRPRSSYLEKAIKIHN